MADSEFNWQQFFEIVGVGLIILIVAGLATIECTPTGDTTALGRPTYSCKALGFENFTEEVEGGATSSGEPDFLAKLQAYWLHLIGGGLSILAIAWVVVWILPRK